MDAYLLSHHCGQCMMEKELIVSEVSVDGSLALYTWEIMMPVRLCDSGCCSISGGKNAERGGMWEEAKVKIVPNI